MTAGSEAYILDLKQAAADGSVRVKNGEAVLYGAHTVQ